MTYVAIVFGLIVVSIYAVVSIPEGCRYVFDPGYFQWRREDDECAANINEIVMFAILTDRVISNTFNAGTAVRLVMSKVAGMSQQDSSRRRKRWMIMFVQGVLQDCLHIVDILTSRYIYKLSDELSVFIPIVFKIYIIPSFSSSLKSVSIFFKSYYIAYISKMETEYPAQKNMNFSFYIFSLAMIFAISSIGLVCNFYFTIKFIFRKPHSNGFQRICTVKTMNNCIICSTFLFWVLPVTLLQFTYSELNYPANRIISGMAALWAYVLNSLLQVCLACNRLYGLYFPLGIAIWKTVPMANMAIAISVTLTSMLSFVSIPVGCGYIYDPNLFVWRTEFHDCSKRLAVIFPFVILGTTIATNAFNVAIGTRLLAMKLIGVKEEEAKERRRRWMVMFIQCVLQDCLQLFDTINSYYIVLLSEKVWFQFLFVTLSLVFIATMDGVVMLACNSDIHPEFVKNWKIKKKQRRNTLVLVTTSGHSIN
ncbi:Protein CBG11470 [Caenorhabditis briggsae]|uniref:Protein CBG11470 n=1 Tax=Caenorhabditis briggsae TaxID=6238 RepID=A8XCX9_CAEBR|nr:Protein CBG11470 [Caenorhabditis briggsae]CAP30497.1 Protein CBG11470 [Caenorhabditis briggsae]